MLHKLVYQFPHRTTGKHQEDPLYTTAKALIASRGGPHGGLFATMKIFDDVPMHYFCEYKRPIRGFAPGGSFATDESRRLVASQESDGADFASALVRSVDEYYSRLPPPPELEVLLVAGTEQHAITKGNKLRFPAQVVREIRELYPTHPYVTVLMFRQAYNDDEVKTIQRTIGLQNPRAVLILISSRDELIRYINTRTVDPGGKPRFVPDDDERISLVSALHIYSHGLASRITFGLLAGVNSPLDLEFNLSHVTQLDARAFSRQAEVASFACRTGVAVDEERFPIKWREAARVSESLAQKLADHLDVRVYSFLKRTNYEPTWNTEDDPVYKATETDVLDTSVHGVLLRPQDEAEALWNPKGAKSPVRAGDLPLGLPDSMFRFEKGKEPVEARLGQ